MILVLYHSHHHWTYLLNHIAELDNCDKMEVSCLVVQGNRMKLCLNPNELSPVAIGGCSKQPFGLDARLARDGSWADQVQGHMLEESQVVCSVALSQTHLIVGKGHIQTPV